jgi:NADH-quinone oxidoreductase subunit L
MFRLYSLAFLGNFRGTAHQQEHLHESPIAMTLPLMVLAFFAVVAGFVGIPELFAPNAHALEHFLAPVFAGSAALTHAHHLEHSTEWILMGTATTIILIVIVYAITKFKKYSSTEPNTGIGKVLENKWYIDELYDTVIVNPLHWFAGFLKNTIEKYVIDGTVNGVGKLVGYGSRQFRLIQSGQVGSYILMMVMALVLFIIIWFNDTTIMRFIHKIF